MGCRYRHPRVGILDLVLVAEPPLRDGSLKAASTGGFAGACGERPHKTLGGKVSHENITASPSVLSLEPDRAFAFSL